MTKTYKDLDVYNLSFSLFIRTHQFSFKFPKNEMYEFGSQLRKSADSINLNIVEGCGQKRYKRDFIKFLVYSRNDETINHLKKIVRLYPHLEKEVNVLIDEYDKLGGKLNRFINYVEQKWRV